MDRLNAASVKENALSGGGFATVDVCLQGQLSSPNLKRLGPYRNAYVPDAREAMRLFGAHVLDDCLLGKIAWFRCLFKPILVSKSLVGGSCGLQGSGSCTLPSSLLPSLRGQARFFRQNGSGQASYPAGCQLTRSDIRSEKSQSLPLKALYRLGSHRDCVNAATDAFPSTWKLPDVNFFVPFWEIITDSPQLSVSVILYSAMADSVTRLPATGFTNHVPSLQYLAIALCFLSEFYHMQP